MNLDDVEDMNKIVYLIGTDATMAEINGSNIQKFQCRIIEWFLLNGRKFPWRDSRDPFGVLVAEIVLKLTGAWKARVAYDTIMQRYGTPALMANGDLKGLLEIFRPLGLHSRAESLIEIARQLNTEFGGVVPQEYSELTKIKGVGKYIANAILCLAYNKRVPLVDGSVYRVLNRCLGIHSTKEAYADENLWEKAEELLPGKNYREYNLGLIDIGAIICQYKKTLCDSCPVVKICLSHKGKVKM